MMMNSKKPSWSVALGVVAVLGLVIASLMFDVPNFTANSICRRGGLLMSDSDPQIVSAAQPPRQPASYVSDGLAPLPNFTLEDAFFHRIKRVDVSQVDRKFEESDEAIFKTRFLPNDNFMEYPVLAVENVCIDPSGALMAINVTHEDINPNITGREFHVPELVFTWRDIYNCTGNISSDLCVGVMTFPNLPDKHSFFPGNTVHFHPHLGNVFHNFAERVWPFIAASSLPVNATTPQPWNHFLIHRFDKWYHQGYSNPNWQTVLWQFRMLMELGNPGADYLMVTNQTEPVCFERLLLQMRDRDRIDHTRLPPEITSPAMRKYRSAVLKYFSIPEPQVRLPPAPLRVSYYGRSDSIRRRIMNNDEVIQFLKNFKRPPMEVYYIDEMLVSGETSYLLPDMLRLYSQTDILIIAHGASTWSTFLMPDGAGVVELFGPCNWNSRNASDITVMKSWMQVLAGAARLKHDISNPFREAIPDPRRGNTTLCKDPFSGVPNYTVDTKKLGQVINSFAYPDRPGDRMTQHWLYDWDNAKSD